MHLKQCSPQLFVNSDVSKDVLGPVVRSFCACAIAACGACRRGSVKRGSLFVMAWGQLTEQLAGNLFSR